jgi:23S rRNA (guanosine2251-2'-O)-methyltransferase
MYIVLDNIRSAWNVGSVIRTCDAIGAELILIGYTPQPVGGTLNMIKKTSIGAENTVKWQSFASSAEVISRYQPEGGWCHLGIEINDKSRNIYEFMKSQQAASLNKDRVLLWLGNEIHGLSDDTLGKMDYILHLPMRGSKESLNVSSCMCAVAYLIDFVCDNN